MKYFCLLISSFFPFIFLNSRKVFFNIFKLLKGVVGCKSKTEQNFQIFSHQLKACNVALSDEELS